MVLASLAGEESSRKGEWDVRKHIKMLECHTRIAFGKNMEELNQQLEHERSGNRVINQYLCNGMMTQKFGYTLEEEEEEKVQSVFIHSSRQNQ